MSGLTFAVPEEDGDGSRAPVSRPEDAHTVRFRPTEVLIETDQWLDPPEEAEVVEGEAHECDDCPAVFGSQQALAGHTGSHEPPDDEEDDTDPDADEADGDESSEE